MGGELERLRSGGEALAAERRLMNEALARLQDAKERHSARRAGRLIFGLDLTGSREAGLQHARVATAAMFDAIKAFGSIEMKVVYYRGTNECRESQWCADAASLTRSMLKLSCERGETQIAKLLDRALREREKLSAVIFIGDHCEEEPERLLRCAAKLRAKAIPLYVFHECADHDERSLQAKPLFKRLAEMSGGIYVEFKPDSGQVLRELLPNIAAFSTAGIEGVKKLALPVGPEARQLQRRLLLASGGE